MAGLVSGHFPTGAKWVSFRLLFQVPFGRMGGNEFHI